MINPDLVAQRDHPGSKLGKPGALQGINTGVNIFFSSNCSCLIMSKHRQHLLVVFIVNDNLSYV